MLRTEAARYARWSAGVAIVLVAITAAVYFQRSWVAHRERRKAPPPAPASVERQSSVVTFSKVQGNRTLFTVRASRSTEFKGKDENLLEDVQITIFGQAGQRHDTIHTTSCQYAKDSGRITCNGDVQMDLETSADAERAQRGSTSEPARVVHVETRGVSFDRENGVAQTEQPVRFLFGGGHGEAVGVEYRSDVGILRLNRDVRLTMRPPATPSSRATTIAKEPVNEAHIRGASLEYRRETNSLRLLGPVDADFGSVHLTAGELTMHLDSAYRAQRLSALPGVGERRPEIGSRDARGESKLSADSVVARFAPAGWVETIEATGSVRGSLRKPTEEDQFQADKMKMQLAPRVNKPQELRLDGNVSMQASFLDSGEARSLQTAAMHVIFAGDKGDGPSRLQHAETLAAATVQWKERISAVGGPPAQTSLSADRLALDFGADGRAQRLNANGNVQTQRQIPGRPLQTATARSGSAQLAAGGGWSQMDLLGDVRLKEGVRTARAEQATFRRIEQTATLSGHAHVRDAATETQAQSITFFQKTGDIRADGAVRSSDLTQRSSAVHLAREAANLAADALVANSQTGRALYTGHARLWQGESVLEADAIELLRDTRGVNANGNVRAVFPQAAFSPKTATRTNVGPGSSAQAAGKPSLWQAQAESLTYRESENKAHLEKNVFVESGLQKIRAAALDIYFNRSGESGAQQLTRAVGTGGVTVEQGDVRGSAESGEYVAAEGKFILSGGTPTIFDAFRGTTTGRQLTFFLADDTIIVDSENGSRTLTKHRVEK